MHDSIRLHNKTPGGAILQVLDTADAIDKAGGNTDLARELFGMLLQELPGMQALLQKAVESGDLQACWDHAHKVYGATAYCGVPALRQAAASLEAAVKAGELEATRQAFEGVSRAISELLAQGPALLTRDW